MECPNCKTEAEHIKSKKYKDWYFCNNPSCNMTAFDVHPEPQPDEPDRLGEFAPGAAEKILEAVSKTPDGSESLNSVRDKSLTTGSGLLTEITQTLEAWQDEGKDYIVAFSFNSLAHELLSKFQSHEQEKLRKVKEGITPLIRRYKNCDYTCGEPVIPCDFAGKCQYAEWQSFCKEVLGL